MKTMVNILLVDDHQIVRDGIKALLEGAPGVRICATASNGKEALEILGVQAVDLVISDISMPEMDGIALAREVQLHYPGIRILALSMFGDASQVSEMLDAGATGYLLKNTGKEELLKAIEKVQHGELYFSQEVSAEMLRTMSERARKKTEKKKMNLTERETEIVRLIAAELSNAEIAAKLFISERTVESHRKNIFRKTETRTVAGLMRYAMENNLLN